MIQSLSDLQGRANQASLEATSCNAVSHKPFPKTSPYAGARSRHGKPARIRLVFSHISPTSARYFSFSHSQYRAYLSVDRFTCRSMSHSSRHFVLAWRFLLFWLFPHSSRVARPYVVTASGCFYAYNSTVLPSPDFVEPCGTGNSAKSHFVNCCAVKSQTLCLSNSICYDPYTDDGKYYLSPCTDPIYNASVCPRYCSKSTVKSYTGPLISSLAVDDLVLTDGTVLCSASVSSEPIGHCLRLQNSCLEMLWVEKRKVRLQQPDNGEFQGPGTG